MRTLYDRRRQVLIGALLEYLGDKVTILGKNAGIHLMVHFTTYLSDRDIINKAAQLGVKLISTITGKKSSKVNSSSVMQI